MCPLLGQKQQQQIIRSDCSISLPSQSQMQLHQRQTLSNTGCSKWPNVPPRTVSSRSRTFCSSGAAGRVHRRSVVSQAKVTGVIFDMDGVLCSSEDLSRRSAAMVFQQLYGLSVQEEEFIPFGGMGEDRFLGGVAEKYKVEGYDASRAKALFFDIYINTFAKPEQNIGYPGAVELVRACRAAGLKVAVGSSAEQVKVDANLAAAGFSTSDFDAIVAADKFEAIKPAPDIFLAAARLMGTPAERCVVVEDAPAGIQAAKNAGMKVIGVTTTLSPAEMQEQGPDVVFDSISSISVSDLSHV